MPCVLIVEDDADVREFMDLLLSSSGYETMTAANGKEALDRMYERRPCMVLLDLAMPVMDGFTFRQRQLEDQDLAQVPVVCVTAVFDARLVEKTLRLPCISKPVEFPVLLDRVEQACGRELP